VSPILQASSSGGFTSPGPSDFWQPLVGHGALALTRPMVVMVLTTIAIALVMVVGTRRLSVVPSKGQAVLESLYGLVRNGIARDIIGRDQMRPYLPLLFGLFFVILVNNLLGVIPVVQYPTFARIGFPIALTLFVYVVYLFVGFRHKGVGGYFKGLVPAGLPGWIVPVIFLLELVTNFVTRPITLALRLFGNMFAGHILLLLFALGGEYMLIHGSIGLKVVSIPTLILYVALTVLEILIEFLQAYVFTLLTATYVADSLSSEHGPPPLTSTTAPPGATRATTERNGRQT
jgi:F-type H+-transporting ATPase subunit a